jgi:hypothetical protein
MKNIKYLVLQNNSLGGTLPAIDAGNRSLAFLSLAYNALTGCARTPLLSASLHAQAAAAFVHGFSLEHQVMSAAGAYRPPGHR